MADRTQISSIGEWLVDQALSDPDIVAMFNSVCYQLYAAGIPLARARVIWPTLHPLFQAETVLWQRGLGCELEQFRHQQERTDKYDSSPVAYMTQNNIPVLRRRLEGPEKQLDFPMLEELVEQGMTDYLTIVTGTFGGPGSTERAFGVLVAWAADRTGGFSDDDIEALQKIQRRFAMACKTAIQSRIAGTIVDTYLGGNAGRQVLDGAVKRGDGQETQAVVWYSDLRGSTALAETLPPDDYFALLNRYYECTAGAAIKNGGEVLDFIGDAVLVVFPYGSADQLATAASAATAALHDAEALCAEFNAARAEDGLPPIRISIGINTGTVMFGNIGVEQRLTFSVIGPTVNEVTRIEALTRAADAFALVTSDIAASEPGNWMSTGYHRLAGVSQQIELFAPKPADDRQEAEIRSEEAIDAGLRH